MSDQQRLAQMTTEEKREALVKAGILNSNGSTAGRAWR